MSAAINNLKQGTQPTTPGAGYTGIYAGSDGALYQITPDGTVIKLTQLNAAGEILIGQYAKIVPVTHGFKFQVSVDGVTWQDAPGAIAS